MKYQLYLHRGFPFKYCQHLQQILFIIRFSIVLNPHQKNSQNNQ